MASLKNTTEHIPTIFVLFGMTGDLVAKKIIPSLWHLFVFTSLNAISLFVNHLIIVLIAANPDVILATINPDFLTFAIHEISIGIPKNLISALSAFVIKYVVIFVGDFL